MYAKNPILTGKLLILGNFTIYTEKEFFCGKRENLDRFAFDYVAMV